MQFVGLPHETLSKYFQSPPRGVLMTCHVVPFHCMANVWYWASPYVCVPTAMQLVALVHETLESSPWSDGGSVSAVSWPLEYTSAKLNCFSL
jgi:hypothetical protein